MEENKCAVLHYETKEVALNVIKFFQAEKKSYKPKHTLDQVIMRASKATGLSEKNIIKLEKELFSVEPGASTSKWPKATSKTKNKKANIDEFRLLALRNLITRIYTVHKETPTLMKIHEMARSELDLRLSIRSLRIVLIEIMGYKYMRLPSGCKVIVENPETRLLRMQYIRALRKNTKSIAFAAILYLNEMWLYKQYMLCKDKESDAQLQWMYIVFEKRSGFICQTQQTTVYDIDPKDLEKWLIDVFLTKLPTKGMTVVMDNVSKNSVTTENWITPHSKKMEMMVWLFKNNIAFDSDMSNIELYGLVNHHRKPKKYVIDETLKENNYQVLRLPQFCGDLNPLKLVQRFVIEKVALSNISDANEIETAIQQETRNVEPRDWAREAEYVKCLEQEYEEQELQMERELEKYTSDDGFIDIVSDSDMNIEDDILSSDDEEFLDK